MGGESALQRVQIELDRLSEMRLLAPLSDALTARYQQLVAQELKLLRVSSGSAGGD